MALNREAVDSALFSRLQALTASGFVTVERRLRHVNDVQTSEQPYLAYAGGLEVPSYDVGRTTQWLLNRTIYVYVRDPAGQTPGVLLNPLLDAVTNVFAFDNEMRNSFTLGGLAMWCRMGTIETDEGTLGEQAIARIPVEMLVVG